MSTAYRGIFAALTTPFKDDQISPEKLKENIARYNAFDLAGYVIAGSTGENTYLTDEEILALTLTAKDAAAPGKKIIVGTGRESTKHTLELTNKVADAGADAALIVLPHYYRSLMQPKALNNHYRAIGDSARIPLIIYSIPQNTGIIPDPELIIELSQHANIIGVKDSSGNLTLLEEAYPHMAAGSTFLLGAGSILLAGLIMGACGGILALGAVAPEVCSKLYRLFLENQGEEAKKLQLDLVPLNQAITKIYGIPGAKYALDLRGYYGGPCRLPLLALEEKDKLVIKNHLTRLSLL